MYVCMYVCMFGNIHTYIHTCINMCRKGKNHHRERGFESALQKPFTGRGVLNRLGLNTLSQFKKSSFDQALWNASKQLWKHRFGHIFWSRQDIRIFGLQLLKTYVFLFIRSKNPHRQRGFEHTYIHAYGLLTPVTH